MSGTEDTRRILDFHLDRSTPIIPVYYSHSTSILHHFSSTISCGTLLPAPDGPRPILRVFSPQSPILNPQSPIRNPQSPIHAGRGVRLAHPLFSLPGREENADLTQHASAHRVCINDRARFSTQPEEKQWGIEKKRAGLRHARDPQTSRLKPVL